MNERVKELMLEAGFAAPELAGRANLLAELIARDICKIIKSQKIAEPAGGYQDWENGYNASVTHAVEQIKRQYRGSK